MPTLFIFFNILSLVCFAFGDSDYLYKFRALPWVVPIIGPAIGLIIEFVQCQICYPSNKTMGIQKNYTICDESIQSINYYYYIPANLFTIINIIMWFAVLRKVYIVLRSTRRQRPPAQAESLNIDFESREPD